MQAVFTRMPEAQNMVTEDTVPLGSDTSVPHYYCQELLCVECGWQGHAHFPDAPWPVFQTHACKLRTESHSTKD